MKITISIIFIIFLVLVLVKCNSNNLSFMTGDMEIDIVETFNNPEKDFRCKKDELACILSYQKYNNDCKNSFADWKKFQNMYHGKKVNGKNIKILAVDTSKNPGMLISGNFDGPRVSLVSRYNISNYDGRLNLQNLKNFLEKNI